MVRSAQHCHTLARALTHTHTALPGLHYPYLGFEVALGDCWLYSSLYPSHSLPGARKNILSGFSCVFIEMLGVQVCDSAAYCGPFQKHYFNNYWQDSLRMAPTECRNMQKACFDTPYTADCYSTQLHGCLVCTGLCLAGCDVTVPDWLFVAL